MKTMKNLYQSNLFPVLMHTIRRDGTTDPPAIRRAPGRPKEKRFRRRERTKSDGLLHSDDEESFLEIGEHDEESKEEKRSDETATNDNNDGVENI